MHTTIELVESSWTNLLATLDGVDEHRMCDAGAVGVWSLKDAIAHIAYWDEGAIGTVERALAGDPEPPDDGVDFETTNQQVHAARADWTVEQAFKELHSTHARLVSVLQMIPDIDPDLIKGDTFGHYDEHIADIRAWRERTGV